TRDRRPGHHRAGSGAGGRDLTITCVVGCYARHPVVNEASVIRVDPAVPPQVACLTGCGVATGWGSAVYAGGVRAGDDVAVGGTGGLGSAAGPGARLAGARRGFPPDPGAVTRPKARHVGGRATPPRRHNPARPHPRAART